MVYLEQCNYDYLRELFCNNSIVLFGAGRAAKTTLQALKKMDEKFLGKIEFIVDNSENKWNTFFVTFEYNIPIVSPEKLINGDNSNKIIIVSSQYLEEIIEQLNSEPLLTNVKVVFYEDICTENLLNEMWLPDDMRMTDKPIIPKVIHYCWFGRNPMPDRYKAWMSTWKKYCPDYEIVEWNENNYDYKKNEYMYDAYKAKKWGFVSDYARLDIIYNNGGIYFDTDVEILRKIDDLLYQPAFMGMQYDRKVATGLGFGAIPRFPIIERLMLDYVNRKFVLDEHAVDFVACPDIQTKTLIEYGFKKINKYQTVNGMNIYPAPVLGAIVGRKIIRDEYVYTIHHYDGSWLSEEKKEKQQVWRNRLK